jgi:hypothetical protein
MRPYFSLAMLFVHLLTGNAGAARYELSGKPLDLYGQVSQNLAYGWNDQYDTYRA